MTSRERAFFDWVAQRGCLVPGCAHPAALHHINGVRSFKTGQRLRRRQHLASFAVVPLCVYHHQHERDGVHALGEEAFGVLHLGGSTAVLEYAYTLALRFIHEGR